MFLLLFLLTFLNLSTNALDPSTQHPQHPSRRALLKSAASAPILLLPKPSLSVPYPTLLSLRSGYNIPSVGFGTYKTPPSSTTEAVTLALKAGVRHIDCGQQYGNEVECGEALKGYKRDSLCLTSKISNANQGGFKKVLKSVKATLKSWNTPYLDVLYVHSPLMGTERRVETYGAIQQLKEEGYCRSVGVCNYGLMHLDEIVASGLDTPDAWQGEVSFYNQRKQEVEWCDKHGVKVVAQSWSKLSGGFNWGSDEDYKVLNGIAGEYGLTKAQVLVGWCLSKGWGCLPRSGVGSSVEREAILQNSEAGFRGVVEGGLNAEDVKALDGLEQGLTMGRLGRTDGWSVEDVKGVEWDLTSVP